MTRFTTAALALGALLVSTSALSAQNGCDIKKSKIQEQLSYAKAHGNTHRVQGLERALQNVNTYCTPNSLRDDARDEVSDRTKEVAERKACQTRAQAGRSRSGIKRSAGRTGCIIKVIMPLPVF